VRPNIKHVQLITSVEMDYMTTNHPRLDEIKLLGEFKHLSTIEVVYRFTDESSVGEPEDGDKVMAEAVAILKKSREKGAKYARIRVIEARSLPSGGYTIWADTVKVSEVWGD